MCGIVGIIGTPNAAKESYLGLLMLQHRGQDSAGILSYDTVSNSFNCEKNLGHIKNAIPEDRLDSLPGEFAIAHTRYSTIGKIRKEDIQPMVMNYPYGIGMVHNGNLINSESVKNELYQNNKRFSLTKNDLEVVMNLLAEGLAQDLEELSFETIKNSLKNLFKKLNGGYSALSILAGEGLLAFKDPHALRPLVWGKRKLSEEEKSEAFGEYAYAIASESKSLNVLGYEDVKELKPGEVLFISKNGKVYNTRLSQHSPSPCMFEWIYFANADSTIWNKNVYQMRLKFGEILGERLKQEKLDIDIVVPVPDTSRPSAITLSEKLGRPYREVLIKNRYSHRTFILNSQKDREKMIKQKLNVVKEEIKGKNILLIDDSIVRGTTSRRIINLLKNSGAKKVYIASTCPPIINPCFYGIDFPTQEELIAFDKSNEKIAKEINSDGVFFLTQEELKKAFNSFKICSACVGGKYPTNLSHVDEMIETRIEHEEAPLPGLC